MTFYEFHACTLLYCLLSAADFTALAFTAGDGELVDLEAPLNLCKAFKVRLEQVDIRPHVG